ncbi:Ig domain-containing protein [Parabacteroides sp. OttesenSCG-928-N08]|nr:Ig domain-containing protein [Parabacteroides sp. OttesenSCG-928-N08]
MKNRVFFLLAFSLMLATSLRAADDEVVSPLRISGAKGGVGMTMNVENVEKGKLMVVEVATLHNPTDQDFVGKIHLGVVQTASEDIEEAQLVSNTLATLAFTEEKPFKSGAYHSFSIPVTPGLTPAKTNYLRMLTSKDGFFDFRVIVGDEDMIDILPVSDHVITYCAVAWENVKELEVTPKNYCEMDRVIYGQNYMFAIEEEPEGTVVKVNGKQVYKQPEGSPYVGLYGVPFVKEDLAIELLPPGAVVPVEAIELDYSELTLKTGETFTLQATVKPDEATNKLFSWSSADEAIATVDEEGVVTAVSEGVTTITATTEDGEFTATCEVTVELPFVAVVAVSLNETEMELEVDETFTLEASIYPDNATDQEVSWSSSKEEVATVDANGFVKALSEGTTTIRVVTKDGEKSAICNVTVIDLSSIGDIDESGVEAYFIESQLVVNTPSEETIELFTANGALIFTGTKQAGLAVMQMPALVQGIYIVKGNSGWATKVKR